MLYYNESSTHIVIVYKIFLFNSSCFGIIRFYL